MRQPFVLLGKTIRCLEREFQGYKKKFLLKFSQEGRTRKYIMLYKYIDALVSIPAIYYSERGQRQKIRKEKYNIVSFKDAI